MTGNVVRASSDLIINNISSSPLHSTSVSTSAKLSSLTIFVLGADQVQTNLHPDLIVIILGIVSVVRTLIIHVMLLLDENAHTQHTGHR